MNPVVLCGVLSVFMNSQVGMKKLELFEAGKMIELSGT